MRSRNAFVILKNSFAPDLIRVGLFVLKVNNLRWQNPFSQWTIRANCPLGRSKEKTNSFYGFQKIKVIHKDIIIKKGDVC